MARRVAKLNQLLAAPDLLADLEGLARVTIADALVQSGDAAGAAAMLAHPSASTPFLRFEVARLQRLVKEATPSPPRHVVDPAKIPAK